MEQSVNRSHLTFLAGGGEMGARMRAMDWSATPLGQPDEWPQSLRSTLSMLLPSKAQIILFWGDEFVVFYNDAYRPVFGAKHPQALGLPGRRAWSEIWDSQLHALLAGVVNTGEAFWARDLLFELERYGFPEETYFDVSYDPVRVESGAVGGVFCIVTETTERVVGERRMALLRNLAARNATARTAHDACVLATEALAANADDVMFALAYLGDELQSATPDAAQQLAGARPDLVKTLPIGSGTGGRPGRLVVGLNPRRPFDGQYRSFLDLVADQLSTTLANARAYEEERQRAEALAAIDRAKTTFFSNVSHEFRTPLTLMLGPIQDLLADVNGPLTVSQRDAIEILQRNAGRLLKLVNALLDFSRIEAGRAQAVYAPTDIGGVTRELAGAFRSAIEHAGIRFEVDCRTIGEPVFVDRDMWEKIVLNLLSNALKFTFNGTIRIELHRRGAGVELTVSDTGTGIPAGELARIFERFHRVEGAKSRTHEGTGIGLALTHELVRLHGGTIAVESEVDEGTRFVVGVPFGSAHLPQDRVVDNPVAASTGYTATPFVDEAARWLPDPILEDGALPAPPPEAGRRGGRRERVLVADDNADMREYLSQLLRDWEVTTVSTGLAALDESRANPPHLIVTDVMMPELDGFGLLRELRADPRTDAIPVLMLSARAGEEARVSGLDAGADDYIIKPFSARELTARVRSLLNLSRARREAELQKRHLRSLFMQAPTPIVILRGPQHVVELANQLTCRIWGRTEAEVLNRPLLAGLPELRDQPFAALLDDVMKSGLPYVGKETPARLDRRGDGTIDTVYLNFVYAPLRGIDDQVEGVLVIAFDVTDEVTARNEMSQLRAAAESANRTKDQFLAILGHELRNPLAPILTALQLMTLRGEGSGLKERTVIDRQVRHLVRLVDDLLDVSRIARGKIELRHQTIELADIVGTAVEGVSPLLEQRHHHLAIDVPRGLLLRGDPTRLTQVVVNVLSNAAKYTEPRGAIAIEARQRGGQVELHVRDSGIGISADMMPHVFEMFAQERQALDRSHGGLGLGLTIVKSLVELHHGTIEAHSDGVGHGSEFVIRLPAAAVAPAVEPVAGIAGQERRAAVPTGRRILVVDDNADAARLLADALELVGYETRVAFDGPEALEAVAEFHPDAALLDLGLPLMDGYELAGQIAAAAAGPRPLLIAVTGYGQVSDREKSLAAGFDAHVVKPVDMPRLMSLLEQLLAADRSVETVRRV
ncbi:MAG TPA: ATP-binding protein [Vicinamibacterales bacterium]|jgi:PAS domain S-box-containing protein